MGLFPMNVGGGGTTDIVSMYLNKDFLISHNEWQGQMTVLLPFTTKNISKLVIDVGYWSNYVTILINGTQIYSGRRKETTTIFDITQYLTSEAMEFRLNNTYGANTSSPSKFTTITMK